MGIKREDTQQAKKPWTTKDAMKQVYKNNLWGGSESDFYSGVGSHDPEIVIPYVNTVESFLASFKIPLIVCDLGCGDFNVGMQLVDYVKRYIAVDIVPDLILRNKAHFKVENLEFHCLDIATENLPLGDCAIVRQVLQHLSNAEVQRIIDKLYQYKYVILSEHIPEGDFIPNIDIISGQGIRLKKHSGIDLMAPPFGFKVKGHKELLSVQSQDNKGVIITTLYILS